MFMMTGEITCPMCWDKVASLCFWKKVEQPENSSNFIHLHVCATCLPKDKTEADVIRIAYVTAFREAIQHCRDVISNELEL